MDIGTAKPSTQERAAIPHHLINVCEPWQSYSAARFIQDACHAIADIEGRGKRALLVGGTMLYYKALEEGLAKLPDADADLREVICRDARRRGWPAIHADLAAVDAQAAKRIHPNDPQRIQRALEVYRITGVPLTRLQQQTVSPLVRAPIKFALVPRERSWLHARIKKRFDQMIDAGFLDEVRTLMSDERNHTDLPSIRSVGYRQAWEFIRASQNGCEDQSSHQAWIDKAVAATRQLAKRQLTWLRGMPNVNLMECDVLSIAEQRETMTTLLQKQGN